ncbi:hypothetical protein E4T38_04626 [Aureobasidium subglaciale]|nr:hypothetical protein E4T38_04626 [Aureobasidium subglaciale]KAI5223757.1 hypothetical protein E4T40_04402 [Aureobasidium subglaciale]KAI5227163.1 hypothetical protein E4T41_04471 [Aureobasidium subglaciale]KAI5262622.1 hypothetical protein E4T46_04357 [Aureobasidium subglaciale]
MPEIKIINFKSFDHRGYRTEKLRVVRPPYLFLRKNHSSDSSVELCPSQLYADIHRCMKPRRQA